jgi:hypothetical protein
MATDCEKIIPPAAKSGGGPIPKKEEDLSMADAQCKHEAKRFAHEASRYSAPSGANHTAATAAVSEAAPAADAAAAASVGGSAAAASNTTRLTIEDHVSRGDGSTRSDKEGKQMYAQMAQYDATHPTQK